MRNDNENVIVTKSLQFAVNIIKFSAKLEEERKYVIARQLLISGTSIGANVREAQNAESKADFTHKLKIAAKEAEETDYWMLLCKLSETYPYDESLHQNLVEIMRILSKIISTSKQ
jgi:four helix bundle protein